MASWPTAQGLAPATDSYNEAGGSDFTRKVETIMGLRATTNGKKIVPMSGFPTARAEDSESSGARLSRGKNDTLTSVARTSILGPIAELLFVPTGKRAVLAPEFSLWLMGFPEAWTVAAPGAKDWLEAQAALESECSKAAETPSSPPSPPSS